MTIEVSAKKVEDAINQGLQQLGATLDDVQVEVLDSGGLFRKAKVRLTLEVPEAAADEEPIESKPSVDEEKPTAPVEDKPREERPEKPAKKEPVSAEKNPETQSAPKKEKPLKNAQTPGASAEKASARSQKAKDTPKESTEESKAQSPAPATPEKAQKPRRTKKSEARESSDARQERDTQREASDTQSDIQSGSDAESDIPVASGEREHTKRKLRKEDIEAASHALEFVKKTVELMGFDGVEIAADDETCEHIEIKAAEGDDSLIIGRHGETLSALTYLAETCARAEKCHINIVVDCNGYRDRRAASLTAMARRRAHESAAKRRRIKLEPMDRIDRRTVHCALADDEYVTTESEGKEPYRYVVIIPKAGEREGSEEDRPRRDRRDRRDRGGRTSAPREKRPVFDMKLYGKVGHNDSPQEEDAEVEKPTTEDAEQ